MKKELSYDLVVRTVHNDQEAIEWLLDYYNSYITALSTYEVTGRNGTTSTQLDEDMKAELQHKLVCAIHKWKAVL